MSTPHPSLPTRVTPAHAATLMSNTDCWEAGSFISQFVAHRKSHERHFFRKDQRGCAVTGTFCVVRGNGAGPARVDPYVCIARPRTVTVVHEKKRSKQAEIKLN